jgi:hypothetical protein
MLADNRAPFPEGEFNPPLVVNRVLSGSVHSVLKLHSAARAGALDPVPDSSSALPFRITNSSRVPSAWFPVTGSHQVKVVTVDGLGCYEAWKNDTVYMEQGNYDARGVYIPGCPDCGSNSGRFTGRCSASGDLSCRAPSQGGGFNYQCVAYRTDKSQAVTYGGSDDFYFYGLWKGYCDQMVGYSNELQQAECSSSPCRQDFYINYTVGYVNYLSGAFTSGLNCTDIQKIRQRVKISGSLPVTSAWVLNAASHEAEFITLFAVRSSLLFPVFGLNEVNSSAVLRIGHFNIEVRSATPAILSANESSGSAFQSSTPGYFQILRLKRSLASSLLMHQPGSYSSISAQALAVSQSASGELLIQGNNDIWDLFNRQLSRSRCASAASNASKVTLLGSATILASVFTDSGAIVRRVVEVQPSNLILDFPLPPLASLPAMIHVTLDETALPCSSAVGSHIFDVVLPPQQSPDTSNETPESVDVRALLLVQALSDVQATAAVHADDMSGFCPNTSRPMTTIDGRVISLPNVTSIRGFTMTQCSRTQLGQRLCLLSRGSNSSQEQCESALETPTSEFYLGASLGINNNELVNASNAEFLYRVASLQKPSDVDVLFKFRMPAFPSSINSEKETSSQPFQADDSNFFWFHSASVIRGGVISDLHSVPLNLTRLPAHDPLIFPRMTLSLADYAQDDVLLSQTSNSIWLEHTYMNRCVRMHSHSCLLFF